MNCRPALYGLVLGLTLFAGPALAAHPDEASEIANLKQRLEALESAGGHGNPAPEEAPFVLAARGRHLTIAGTLEIEVVFEKTKGEASRSALNLATAEVSLEAELGAALTGHLTLLYEQNPDDDNLTVDEAVLTLRSPQPLFGITPALHAGRQYVPFGNYNSFMVSDPFTVAIGETRATAALLELAGAEVSLSGGVFSGSADTGRDRIDGIVAAVKVTPVAGVAFGASWLSDLAESGAGLVADSTLYHHRVPAGSAFVSLACGPLSIAAEALAALADFDPALVGLDSSVPVDGIADTALTGPRPRAWNLELALAPLERLQIAGRYEEVRDFAADARRYGGTVSWGIFDQTVLALEYLYTNRDPAQGDSQTVTAQLATEF